MWYSQIYTETRVRRNIILLRNVNHLQNWSEMRKKVTYIEYSAMEFEIVDGIKKEIV